MFALATPVLVVLIAGAIDLASVGADITKAQDVADSSALAAAKQLTLADTQGVEARARAYADIQLADLSNRFAYTVTTTPVDGGKGVTVTIAGKRSSFFGDLLPPGGWNIRTQATASAMGRAPLCVLSTGVETHNEVEMQDDSKITAANCMVHGNTDIDVSSNAWLQAAIVQAAGLATGRISPAPQTGAPEIADPFTALNFSPPTTTTTTTTKTSKTNTSTTTTCTPADLFLEAGSHTLAAGVHCVKIKVSKNAVLNLQPGDHFFHEGDLEVTVQLPPAALVRRIESPCVFWWRSAARLDSLHACRAKIQSI